MGVFDTALTCGPRLRAALLASDEVRAKVDRIFPVTSRIDEALPFVAFYRAGMSEDSVKSAIGPQSAIYEFQIYSETWEEGLEIADRMVETLSGIVDDAIRSIRLANATEDYYDAAKAYVQIISFTVKTRK